MHAVCTLYVGTLESRGTANLGSGDDRIYPLGRVPTVCSGCYYSTAFWLLLNVLLWLMTGMSLQTEPEATEPEPAATEPEVI